MENLNVEKIIVQRIKENEELFTIKELQIISNNVNIIKKIYLIGLINGRQIYGNNLQ